MAVPYHTHNFEIPAATREDIIAGVATDKVAVPASLGTAAVRNVEEFATAEQGKKASTAIQKSDLAKVATSGSYNDLENRPELGTASAKNIADFATADQGKLAELAVKPSRSIVAGDGLAGGGPLSGDLTLSLSPTSLSALKQAETSVQPGLAITAGIGLVGGGTLEESRELSLSDAVRESLLKADSAIQSEDIGELAQKDKITIADIDVTGTASAAMFLSGDGSWKAVPGGGDMLAAIFDPHGKKADAFDRANHSGVQPVSSIDGLQQELDKKQPALGFVPVRQGGFEGVGIGTVSIGWGANSRILLNVDKTSFGDNWPMNISGLAFPRKADGTPINFHWEGRDGQPPWLLGGADGADLFVYNPANFNVSHAVNADNANAVGGQTQAAIWAQIESRANAWAVQEGLNRTRDYLLAEHIPVGGYACLRASDGVRVDPGQYVGGNVLGWSNNNNDFIGPINFGTWQLCGFIKGTSDAEDQTTTWKRTG